MTLINVPYMLSQEHTYAYSALEGWPVDLRGVNIGTRHTHRGILCISRWILSFIVFEDYAEYTYQLTVACVTTDVTLTQMMVL